MGPTYTGPVRSIWELLFFWVNNNRLTVNRFYLAFVYNQRKIYHYFCPSMTRAFFRRSRTRIREIENKNNIIFDSRGIWKRSTSNYYNILGKFNSYIPSVSFSEYLKRTNQWCFTEWLLDTDVGVHSKSLLNSSFLSVWTLFSNDF